MPEHRHALSGYAGRPINVLAGCVPTHVRRVLVAGTEGAVAALRAKLPDREVEAAPGDRGAVDCVAYPDLSVHQGDVESELRGHVARLAAGGCVLLRSPDKTSISNVISRTFRGFVRAFKLDSGRFPELESS